MSLKIGALFAGMGGLDLAVESVLDSRVAWLSEFDAAPSRILAHRYPDAPNHGDVTKIDWTAVEPVDIITGGSPCQDLSHAGKRAGMVEGTRSGLWVSMVEGIRVLRPSLVVWENVRGALTAEGEPPTPDILELEAVRDRTHRALTTVQRRLNRALRNGEADHVRYHRRDTVRLARRLDREVGAVRRERAGLVRAIGRVVGDLAELGYDAAWCGLRAADVGAPHGRWRVFVVAWPADAEGDRLEAWRRCGGAGEEVAGPDCHIGALPAWGSREWRDLTLMPSPRTSDTNGAGAHGSGGLDLRTAVSLLPTPRATRGGSGTETMYGLGAERSNDGRAQGVVLMPTPSVADVEGGRKARSGARSNELLLNGIAAGQRFGDYAPAIARWEAVLGRPAPDPTEPTGKDGAHRLSSRFVEFMMGLPSGWVTDPAIWEGMKPSTARNAQLKALGNGVVPQQAAAAIRHLLALRDAS